MDVLNNTFYQLGRLKSFILHDRLIKKVIYDYLIIDEMNLFLNVYQLRSFIAITKIYNTTFLKEINNLCSAIIYLCNNELKELEPQKRRKDVLLPREELNIFIDIDSLNDFRILEIYNCNIYDFESDSYEDLITDFSDVYNYMNLEDIVLKCGVIYDFISSAYPDTEVKEIKGLYQDKFAIDYPMKNPYNLLYTFVDFKSLNLHNLKTLNPIIENRNGFLGNSEEFVVKDMHNDIFLGDSVLKFENCLEKFCITQKSRSDMKFIFEMMKKDGEIHNGISQAAFLNWLTETYDLAIGKTNNFSITKKRMSLYSMC